MVGRATACQALENPARMSKEEVTTNPKATKKRTRLSVGKKTTHSASTTAAATARGGTARGLAMVALLGKNIGLGEASPNSRDG